MKIIQVDLAKKCLCIGFDDGFFYTSPWEQIFLSKYVPALDPRTAHVDANGLFRIEDHTGFAGLCIDAPLLRAYLEKEP